LTIAVKELLAVVCIVVGGVELKKMLIGGGVAVMLMLAEIDLVWSAVDVAVIFTVLPEGTAVGAVYVVAVPLAV